MDQTIKKGNSMIGFLRRNLKVSNESTKQLQIFLSSDPYWSTVAQSGAPTPKIASTSLKWSRVEPLGMLQTDTTMGKEIKLQIISFFFIFQLISV